MFTGYRITSRYGLRLSPITGTSFEFHTGIDLASKLRAPVKAFTSGRVTYSGWGNTGTGYGNYGNVVAVKDEYGFTSMYAHLDSVTVKVGDIVKVRQEIGKEGASGKVTGPHLHYEVRAGGWGTHVDPTAYLTQYNKTGGDSMFTDINEAWYPKIIIEAAELGLIAGYDDGTIRPKENLTFERFVYILMRYRARDLHQQSISELVEKWKDSVVVITNVKKDGVTSVGSGSFIDDKGTILTNKHVTDNFAELTVHVYGNEHIRDAEFIRDSTGIEEDGALVDLALIRAVGLTKPTPPVKMATEVPAHGSFCFVIGNPLALLPDTATFGIVSHTKRGHRIQVDASINPGNSGGACFDLQGNMIGVPTSKYMGIGIDNLAFLTSCVTVNRFLARK